MLQLASSSNQSKIIQTSSQLIALDGISFNSSDPMRSITDFFNHRVYCNSEEKVAFVSDVREFFCEKAFRDEKLNLSEVEKQRFSNILLPALLDATTLTSFEKQRMVAVAEKVTGIHFTTMKGKYHVDQFITKDPVTANERWGWLSHEDVVSFGFKQNTDSKLKFDASRRNDAGYTIPDILDFEGLSPSAQRALEVLGAFFPDFKPSIPSLLEILDFAVKRQLNPLINEVIGLFKGIDSWEEYETFSECVCQYLDDPSFTEALKALNEPLILGDDFTEVQKTQIAVFNDALSKPLKNRTRGNQSASADANMIAVDRGASRFSI